MFLLIESRPPADGGGHGSLLETAMALRGDGQPVRLLLIQDGVAATALPGTAELVAAGGEVWVDGFSLRQRGLAETPAAGARVVDMDAVADVVLDPDVRVVWH